MTEATPAKSTKRYPETGEVKYKLRQTKRKIYEKFEDLIWKTLEMAHKAEAERRGASFTFYCQAEALDGTRMFSHTNRGRFWTGINRGSLEVHHLWLPYDSPDEDQDEAEFERWFNLIHPGALQSAKRDE